ncbi:MAG: alpha-2-macroglobulin [Chitinophagales bacterium]|nr:alpha-2-macroglobulin [Chitinophagales bacterium]
MHYRSLLQSTSQTVFIIIVLLLLNLALLFAFGNQWKTVTPVISYDTYEKLWREVDALESQGLTKSALEKVNTIYSIALKSDNAPQLVKSLIYTVKYKDVLEEGEGEKALEAFEKAISESKFPARNILESAAAELYWSYYQQNRWTFAERTQLSDQNGQGVATWDLPHIVQRATALYTASLLHADSLQQTAITPFAAILEEGNMPESLRPTLYDFLAHRALDFFTNEEAYVTLPAYKFEITGEEPFQPYEKFITLNFTTVDTTSGKYQALLILQHLLAFHSKEKNTAALIDADLKRFQLLRSNSVHDLKDSLYLSGLQQLENRFSNDSASGAVSFTIAQYFVEHSSNYQPPRITVGQFDKQTAMRYCDRVISKFPASAAADDCRALRSGILQKNISLTVESVNLPDEPFRALAEYQNTDSVYFRIIRNTPAMEERAQQADAEKMITEYLRQPVLQSWMQSFTDPGDYQSHAAEIKIPAMPLGNYIILCSSTAGFSLLDGGIAKAATTVSNIGYITKRYKDHYSVYVLHRESGKPLPKVEAKLLSQQYDQQSRSYRFREEGRYTTDQQGYFEIPATTGGRNFRIEFTTGEDKLLADDYFYLYRNNAVKEKITRTIFFTDRSVYRPGQAIHFKGIVLENENDKNILKSNFSSVVELIDVNGQKVSALDLVTNKFGSFQGTFTAPVNSLNGSMSIRNASGSVEVSVEEYKRPRFEVMFDTLQRSWRLKDTVKVVAMAKSFAGANIDGAAVSYRVVRQARFPIWYYGRKRVSSSQYTQAMEISSGTTVTDASGAFTISFPAIPDLKIPAAEKPQFDYRVIAEVADIMGETRSAETVVTIGYVSINVDAAIPENVSADSVSQIAIKSENLNGFFEPAQGTVVISHLVQPGRIFRERLWKRPDQFVMTKDVFYRLFPADVYDNEDDYTTWEKQLAVSSQTFNTAISGFITLPANLPAGKYELALQAQDRYGESVTVKKYFTVSGAKDKNLALPQSCWFSELPKEAEVGSIVPFQLGTSEKDIRVIFEVEAKNLQERKIILVKKGKQSLSLPVSEEMKGGVNINALTIRHGRVYSFSRTINVPYTDKELKLEFESFRNKLLPGQSEQWKIRISGYRGEAVAAEIVASLYDASLDAFKPHTWPFSIENIYYPFSNWEGGNCFGTHNAELYAPGWSASLSYHSPVYDRLNWFGYNMGYDYLRRSDILYAMPMMAEKAEDGDMEKRKEVADSNANAVQPGGKAAEQPASLIRKNLQETAFFFPQLQTDSTGVVIISFTIPEALTRWKLLGFAHTTDLQYGMITKELVTQKDFMVIPNAPRFFREGDQLSFTAKVTNLSNEDLSGTATLQLFDAISMRPVDAPFENSNPVIKFSAAKHQSSALTWTIKIPEGIEAVSYRVMATSGQQSDGEENILPVLSNRMLVTESLPLNISGNQSKSYSFTKLLQSGASSTIKNHKLTLEFTGNPAWYAVQALPYMMEYPYQCSEQTFNRFYANALASSIVKSTPRIQQVFDTWKNLPTDAFLSNLEKNQELKTMMLQETPWVMQANDESDSKKRIALLFEMNRMSGEMDAALSKLEQLQMTNGGWSWFAGGPDDRYITQYIVTGIGHLQRLNALKENDRTQRMLSLAVPYLDERIKEEYEELLRHHVKPDQNNFSYLTAQYLYARSFFTDMAVSAANKKAFDYYQSQAQQYWMKQGIYAQGMVALALFRMNDKKTPAAIIRSLKENSITQEELGMYWKSNSGGYYWHQAPIETQALLIEAFDEITGDAVSVDNMKSFLLKQKQTNNWKTTKATAEAVYALLLRGSSWLDAQPAITVSLGKTIVDLSSQSSEAGTGYYKYSWQEKDIQPQMGEIKVSRKGPNGISWGAVYWQYFEQLDKITPSTNGISTPLSLQKKLFIQRNTAAGPVLESVTAATRLKPGDLVKVRIELHADRDMEYVHMKDQRAACFEPINVLSDYSWQDGLGYYEETKDASTNFFFNHLPKGTYVFEYPLRVQLKGDFSNGITTVQCMYAPEFTNHSEGVRVVIN